MAYLNVRERRIEARIAYVGAPLAGKATNIEHLGRGTSTTGDTITAEWRPPTSSLSSATFRDCDVTVKLVSARGTLQAERFRELLQEVDGIIFVADAGPGSTERNRASLAAVRDAIEAGPRRDLPVVVQVNKTDLDDAMSADELASTLGLGTWPRVNACALRGEGVVETASRALAEILELLQKGGDPASGGDSPDVSTPRPPPARVEGNPLLTALRQVLRDTVSEHVVSLEAKSGAALMHSASMEESARTRAAVEALVARVEGLERTIERTEEQMRRGLEQQDAALAALVDAARATPTTLERLGEGIRGELARVVESRAKVDREHATATATTLKRALDAVASDVKTTDPRASLGELRTAVQGAAEQTKALVEPSTAAVRTLAARLDDVEATIQREVRSILTRAMGTMEDRIDLLRLDASDGFEKNEERNVALHALLTELIEELKKPKKGWFG